MIQTLYNVLYRMQRLSLDQCIFKAFLNKVPVYVVTIIDAYLQSIMYRPRARKYFCSWATLQFYKCLAGQIFVKNANVMAKIYLRGPYVAPSWYIQ
jgi:hypothetical protein